jgi:hypothetical protein
MGFHVLLQSFIYFYMKIMFVPHRKYSYRPPGPVTEIALLIYMYTMFVPHRKHTGLHDLLHG